MFRFITIALLTFFLPQTAMAASPEDARQFVDTVGKRVLDVVNSQGTEAQKQPQLRQLFIEHVDTDWMGQFVLSRAWAKASEEQRGRYLQAYREHLLARYTTNFADYTGSKYTVTNARAEADGQFTVGMAVKSPNAEQKDVQAGYRVRTNDAGELKIIDIIIEGVSLLTTQRSEFGTVVQKDGIDGLTKQLQSKTQNVSK